uniref:Uncharacterized protein n=1 Tax=Oryza meridionalis TaxID=40149 RepID=A0A0E0DM88_9ORYZ
MAPRTTGQCVGGSSACSTEARWTGAAAALAVLDVGNREKEEGRRKRETEMGTAFERRWKKGWACLKDHYEEALRRNDVKAIVVTAEQLKIDYVSIDVMTNTLEAAGKPSVAAINGPALGGGLEISMVCQARISIPTAQLGLPELQLGVIPAFGGTQRLPRLVGLTKALEMMLMSKPIKAEEAHQLGLIDAIDYLSRVRKGKMTKEIYEKTLSLLTGVVDYERFKDVDLVIEESNTSNFYLAIYFIEQYWNAVVENVKVKQQVFADLERYCPSHCVLATNTSTIDLDLIGEKTNSQDRIAGAHFFSPAHVMPLLEIVRSKRTSPQVVVDLLDVGKKIKKTPVVVGNCTGFAVNRMFSPYTSIALLLVDRGMDVYKIDQVCTEFGMPMGPFRLLDLVGFGVALASGMQYLENSPGSVDKSMLIPLMFEDKRTGEASQKGFYKYEGNRKAIPDPDIFKYVEESRSMAGTVPDLELLKLDDKEIVEMVFFPVINEACQVLGERIANKASDLDIASIFGMGFPPYRGGIMYWADSIGAKRIHARLSEWEMKHGQLFRPCSYLSERAAEGVPLSSTAKNNSKARM